MKNTEEIFMSPEEVEEALKKANEHMNDNDGLFKGTPKKLYPMDEATMDMIETRLCKRIDFIKSMEQHWLEFSAKSNNRVPRPPNIYKFERDRYWKHDLPSEKGYDFANSKFRFTIQHGDPEPIMRVFMVHVPSELLTLLDMMIEEGILDHYTFHATMEDLPDTEIKTPALHISIY